MAVFIINFKNYPEAAGSKAIDLASAVQSLRPANAVEFIVAPPTPMLGAVAAASSLQVFCQGTTEGEAGKSTGRIVLEAVKAAGAAGTILNHSESRLGEPETASLVARARGLGLKTCVCAGTSGEAGRLALLAPDYLAVEPPELVGTGVAVSRARPEVVSETVEAARRAGYKGSVLCGAGITGRDDVEKAVALGVDGILVSSAVVLAKDWRAKVGELSGPLSAVLARKR